jgi:hypothetical protein
MVLPDVRPPVTRWLPSSAPEETLADGVWGLQTGLAEKR